MMILSGVGGRIEQFLSPSISEEIVHAVWKNSHVSSFAAKRVFLFYVMLDGYRESPAERLDYGANVHRSETK